MLYVAVMVLAVVVTVAMTRRTPQTAIRLGIAAVVAAAIAITIALLTGNLLLFYLGALAWPFGVLLLLARTVAACRQRFHTPPTPVC